ncbi:MAG: hypothetical protein ACREOG_00070, partial [Gemmatimonadaceae bacterium]
VTAVLNYLPASGLPQPLSADLVDPTSSISGIFGGDVLGLRFNVDFSDAGYTLGTSGVRFGDLTLCGFTGLLTGLNGLSVRAFSAIVNTALGGGSSPYSIADLNQMTFEINNAFSNGIVGTFAQQHLFSTACPTAWQDGNVITYRQDFWGDQSTAAGILLVNQFDAVYAATTVLEVGISGAGGFSMVFSSAAAANSYLPSPGNVGPLNADLLDPTSSLRRIQR